MNFGVEFQGVHNDLATLLRKAETARQDRAGRLRELIAYNEKRLVSLEHEKREIQEASPKHCANLARIEAMTAADILRELLPAPKPEQPTVAEHVQAPQLGPSMFALCTGNYWLGKGAILTLRATLVEHYSEQEAAEKCELDLGLTAYRLDDLHAVDGLLKIKPGSKPAMLPGKVRT